MKLLTPLDYWRAGFELWLAGWKAQVDLADRMLAAGKAAQEVWRAPEAAGAGAPTQSGDARLPVRRRGTAA